MRKFTLFLVIFVAIFLSLVELSFAADRYWIVDTPSSGNWNDTNNWSTSSNGSGGASVPGASDVAYFDANGTGNCTINADVNVAGIDTTGYTATVSANATTKTLTIGSSNINLAAGIFTWGSGAITINGAFTLSGGTFTSSSGSLNIYNTFTHSGGAFAHNNGTTVFYANNTYTITTTGNADPPFYNVIFTKDSGNVATISLSNNGGYGYIAGDLTIKNEDDSDYTVQAAAVNPLDHFDIIGNVSFPTTVQTGNVYFGSSTNNFKIVIDKDFTINEGYMYATYQSGWTGNQYITQNGGTIDYGTWVIYQSTILSSNLVIGGNFFIGGFSSFYTNGYNLTVSGTFTINQGTFKVQGGETLTLTADTTSPEGAVMYVGSGSTTYTSFNYGNAFPSLTINSTTGNNTFSPNGALTVNGSLTITSGTLDVTTSNYGINVAGNWSNSGTFTARGGTVTFSGTGTSIFSGTTIFNNLTCTTVGKILTFTSATTQTINRAFTITGTAADRIVLSRYGGSGLNQWGITIGSPNGSFSVSGAKVSDSDASGGQTIAATNTIDGGNNTNWTFAPFDVFTIDGVTADGVTF